MLIRYLHESIVKVMSYDWMDEWRDTYACTVCVINDYNVRREPFVFLSRIYKKGLSPSLNVRNYSSASLQSSQVFSIHLGRFRSFDRFYQIALQVIFYQSLHSVLPLKNIMELIRNRTRKRNS